MPKAWKHHKDKAEYLTMFWLKFEDDTPKNVITRPCDWWRETREGWFCSEETILWEIHGVSRLEYDISSKMDAIDNCKLESLM